MKKVASTPAKKTTVKDQWVAAAMTDDQMVAELLLRLKHAGTETPETNPAPLRWGIRQRRSRSSRFGGGGVTLKKDADSVRGSPKTPLSWSGGSGGVGGDSASPSAEDTSRQASCSTSTGYGSKVLSLPLSLKTDLVFSSSRLRNPAAAERYKSFNLSLDLTEISRPSPVRS